MNVHLRLDTFEPPRRRCLWCGADRHAVWPSVSISRLADEKWKMVFSAWKLVKVTYEQVPLQHIIQRIDAADLKKIMPEDPHESIFPFLWPQTVLLRCLC